MRTSPSTFRGRENTRPVRRTSALAVLAAALLMPGPAAHAAQHKGGSLDKSFSGDGRQSAFPNGATGDGVALDPKGRSLTVGFTAGEEPDVVVVRLRPNGTKDTSFGDDGKVITDLGAAEAAYGIAVQSDGRIVVVGDRKGPKKDKMMVLRYKPDGDLDPSFGGDGKVLTEFGKKIQIGLAVAITPSEGIVVGGSVSNGTTSRSALARYLPGGGLDHSFGGDGKVTTDLSASVEQFEGVAVLGGGKIVAAGHADVSLTPAVSIARYTKVGKLDKSFGEGGATVRSFTAGPDVASAVALQKDGRAVVVGYAGSSATDEWLIVRFGTKGHVDKSFAHDGSIVTNFGPGFDSAYGVAIQPNDRIVVAGRIDTAHSKSNFGVARFKPNGGRDTSFGGDGSVTTDFAGGTDEAHGVALQKNGRILVAGFCTQEGTRRVGVVRYWPN